MRRASRPVAQHFWLEESSRGFEHRLLYSPECVEEKFCELRLLGLLVSSHNTSGNYYAPLSAWPELRWSSGGAGERTLPRSKN